VLLPLTRLNEVSRNALNSSSNGRACSWRVAARRSGACPRTLLSMANRAEVSKVHRVQTLGMTPEGPIRCNASSATGEAVAWWTS